MKINVRSEKLNNIKVPSYSEIIDYLEQVDNPLACVDLSGSSVKENKVPYVKIGKGPKIIGITGGAHSDEPVGVATCFLLIQELLENPLNEKILEEYSFAIHPCLDVDGSLLNYRWANNQDYTKYLLHNFRNNNPSMDVEHGIAANSSQETRPELEYLMRNLSPFKGEFGLYVTLHTTHSLAGALVLLFCDNTPGSLVSTFKKSSDILSVPLDNYIPKPDEGLTYISSGFLKSPSFKDFKKAFEQQPEVLKNYKYTTYEWVNSSLDCPLCLISEFPFNLDREFNNHKETTQDLADFKKDENTKNLKTYCEICSALERIEEFDIDRENPWYKKASLYRSHARSSFEKPDEFYDQFKGIKVTEADLYEKELAKIENKMKKSILKIKILENIPNAKDVVDSAFKDFDELGNEWKNLSRGTLLSTEKQVELQLALLNSGITEINT